VRGQNVVGEQFFDLDYPGKLAAGGGNVLGRRQQAGVKSGGDSPGKK